MECVEAAALKNSFRRECFSVRGSPQAFAVDEILAVNVASGVPSDDFSVDELLDLSNQNGFVEEGEEGVEVEGEEEERREEEMCKSTGKDSISGFLEIGDFPAASTGELNVPADDAADLEWLSHFVEDSFSEYSAPFPAGMLPEKPWNQRSESRLAGPQKSVSERPCFRTPVPAKARSKRARTGGRVWSVGSTPSLSESSASSSSSTTSSTPPSPWFLRTNFGLNEPANGKSPAKRQKRRLKQPGPGGWSGQPPRRCSHCGVQKTPQWRAGPLGAKTLCNACGVRFKSGRLLPEYRPACSPTFSSDLHSNHHRKVLEMRRKKEASLSGQPESVLAVPTF